MRKALRMLEGRVGRGGQTLHMGLSRMPAVELGRMWRWIHEVEDNGGDERGKACLEDEW